MTKASQLFEHILTHYRGQFATLFLLPISVLYGVYSDLRNWIVFRLNSAPAKHDARVLAVIQQIENWKQDGAQQKLCTARSGWKTMSELVPKYKLSHRNIHIDMDISVRQLVLGHQFTHGLPTRSCSAKFLLRAILFPVFDLLDNR